MFGEIVLVLTHRSSMSRRTREKIVGIELVATGQYRFHFSRLLGGCSREGTTFPFAVSLLVVFGDGLLSVELEVTTADEWSSPDGVTRGRQAHRIIGRELLQLVDTVQRRLMIVRASRTNHRSSGAGKSGIELGLTLQALQSATMERLADRTRHIFCLFQRSGENRVLRLGEEKSQRTENQGQDPVDQPRHPVIHSALVQSKEHHIAVHQRETLTSCGEARITPIHRKV